MEKDIEDSSWDFIFTVNFCPLVSVVCHKLGVRYVSWTYDTPMNIERTDELCYPTSYIFIFDHAEYVKYRNQGMDNVYYLPLASGFSSTFSDANDCYYKYDVSLIGNLYKSTYPVIKEKLDKYYTGYLDGIMTAQRGIYGSYFVLDLLKEQNTDVENINKLTGFNLSPEQLSYSLAAYMTYLDRLSILAVMSNRYKTALVTGSLEKSEKELLKQVSILPKMDYDSEMPKLFGMSKINLNPPFRAMYSGIPQRALDIMSCGGFLLSGYTQELAYYFEDGNELVLYDSIEDAVEKAGFYLKHDELRDKIRRAGQEKVKTDFGFSDRISVIAETMDE
ncbi:glycosyltransferase family protein [Oribacterium sp. WCC10]|uniref:glycosyltransferase family protein n=1 Tax=Oribacterium sp. WCC10 TaxID=1855343 RepID=UPI001587BB55|nr:glycosyltransferase [Oribacterium sp. WCC10]